MMNDKINSRERMARAMRHEMPDRVPVMCQLALGHYFLHSKQPPSAIWFDSPTYVRAVAELRAQYGLDGMLLNLPGRPANWRDYVTAHEHTREGERLTWQNGLITLVPADDNPHTFTAGGGPLPRADFESVDTHNPATFQLSGYIWNTWHAPSLWDIPAEADLANPQNYPAWFTDDVRLARQLCPETSLHVEVFSPFTHLLELFSYEQALMALIERPALCHELLLKFTHTTEAQIKLYAACDPDAILISSAFAGAGFISRTMYREFVLPYEQQLAACCHARQKMVYTHTCGAIGDRLDLMIETGIDGIDTLDPRPLGTVDLAEAKEKFGHKVFFKGNLDSVNEMLRADDATFECAVLERLRIGALGSGYILSSACSVAPRVAPERLRKMVQLAEVHGRY